MDYLWLLLLFSPLLLVLHFVVLGVFRWASSRLRPIALGYRLRRILAIQCWLPFTYIPLAMILPDAGHSGEPLGISYTGAFLFCIVGAAVMFLHLLTGFIVFDGLRRPTPSRAPISTPIP